MRLWSLAERSSNVFFASNFGALDIVICNVQTSNNFKICKNKTTNYCCFSWIIVSCIILIINKLFTVSTKYFLFKYGIYWGFVNIVNIVNMFNLYVTPCASPYLRLPSCLLTIIKHDSEVCIFVSREKLLCSAF